MIQIISFSGKEKRDASKYVISSMKSPQSLDEFEINIIDLSDQNFWRNTSKDRESCNSYNDLVSINAMIRNSKMTRTIIVLPQNCTFRYCYHGDKYIYSCELKDMIDGMKKILGVLFSGISRNYIYYENTTTTIGDDQIKAAFYFENKDGLLYSNKSKKNTAVVLENVCLTSLQLDSDNKIDAFLLAIGLTKKEENAPSWFSNIIAFDDVEQKEKIANNEEIIEEAKSNISIARDKLRENERFKSVLYTSGNELVEVIFEMLQEMLGCDLSNFRDEKKEDFLFEFGPKIYIGEIKGINHNVKSANVSQLDVHVQDYLDNHTDKRIDDIVALLIINHQRTITPDNRDAVHATQIALAERNGSLIIETPVFLAMFEDYRDGRLGRNDVINLFEKSGLLKYNNN